MGNSCTSIIPNTSAREQQERNKIQKQTKKVRREAKECKKAERTLKKSIDGMSLPNQY